MRAGNLAKRDHRQNLPITHQLRLMACQQAEARRSRPGTRLSFDAHVAHQSDPASPHELDNPIWTNGLNEGFDLALLPRDLDHQLLSADVDNVSAEDLDELDDFAPLSGRRLHLDQHQVAFDKLLARVV